MTGSRTSSRASSSAIFIRSHSPGGVFARDVLLVDAVGLGALSAATGVGSFVGALAIAFSRSVPRSGLMFWAGSWSGEGALTTADGTRSRIRCVVTYAVQDRGRAVRIMEAVVAGQLAVGSPAVLKIAAHGEDQRLVPNPVEGLFEDVAERVLGIIDDAAGQHRAVGMDGRLRPGLKA